MDVLGDLVSPERGDDTLWIHRPGPRSRSWSGEQFCVDAWKAGNLLRHYGVREGAAVALLDGGEQPDPQALIGLFGAWTLGAAVRPNPSDLDGVDAVVGPTDGLDGRDLPPGCKALGFGDPPDDPTVAHFEGERWSENPVQFPADVEPSDPALEAGGQEYTHAELLADGRDVSEAYGLGADDRVGLQTSLSDPEAVVAGVIAPLLASATITLGGEATATVRARDGRVELSERR
ncbi:hypothetical protein [Halapricum hydrolyticum]|uniref:Long-chain fatty acid--CoA ligase n=1 Tax=Halapricum hydrolyticum TaxID=2979991 RepID=A0AAE3LDY5_9EURY|nr:hypothetical protein [Halapricum hydrolyticum]MCU4716723.1 long-chain fatty acid--CoA ligase [Halapricum hydrolyticum]MCU4725672.1 long-chain fatty acid--CoA ligase [Halapricum hydrolyticum]